MILIPVGVLWAGYTVLWYGFSMLKGSGIGFTDLIIPGRVGHIREVMTGWSSNTSATKPVVTPEEKQAVIDAYVGKKPAVNAPPKVFDKTVGGGDF